MSPMSSRRNVLRVATAAAATSVAGCIVGNQESQGSNLFVENTKGTEQIVHLIVSPGDQITDDRVLDDWFRIPQDVALEFQGVIESGQTYTIGVQAAYEEASERVAVTVDPCEGNSDGNRDISVRIRNDGHGVIPWGCNEEYTERNLEYESADQHRIEPPADRETWTSPTPQSTESPGGGAGQ